MSTQATTFWANRMDQKEIRKQIRRWAICLAPSAVILAVIWVGAGLRVPLFELSWNNDCVFALLVTVFLLPLTKLPLLFFDNQEGIALTGFPDLAGGASAAAQIQILRARLEYLNKE